MRRVSAMNTPVSGRRCSIQRRPSAHSSAISASASPLAMVGDQTSVAEAHVAEHHAAALGHAVHFALLDLKALLLADQRQRLRDHQHALAADADDHHVQRARRLGRGLGSLDLRFGAHARAIGWMQSVGQTWAQSVQPMQAAASIATLCRPS